MTTKNQGWAQQRNFNKMRISGARGTVSNVAVSESTTVEEWRLLNKAFSILDKLWNQWEKNNKESKIKYTSVKKDLKFGG